MVRVFRNDMNTTSIYHTVSYQMIDSISMFIYSYPEQLTRLGDSITHYTLCSSLFLTVTSLLAVEGLLRYLNIDLRVLIV